MAESPYIRVLRGSKRLLFAMAWGLMFFFLLNIGIWYVFDLKFFDWIGFDRLLMQPSDNEVRSLIKKMRTDDRKHIVLLGDSIVWGVGVNNPKETISGGLEEYFSDQSDVRVVNMSVPGSSFLDATAAILESYDERNVYLFFVNPMLFEDYYANRDFEEVVRFKELVKRNVQRERERFEKGEFSALMDDILFRSIPLYRNRDLISKRFIGLHPSIAVNALLHRIRTFRFQELFTRKPMDIGGEGEKRNKLHVSFRESRTLAVLREVSDVLKGKQNVFMVILDDNKFEKGPQQDRNVRYITETIQEIPTLNLYRTVPIDRYLDSVHMKPEGHALVAAQIFAFLKDHHAP